MGNNRLCTIGSSSGSDGSEAVFHKGISDEFAESRTFSFYGIPVSDTNSRAQADDPVTVFVVTN